MNVFRGLVAAALPLVLYAQDAREIVRRSVALDQANTLRIRDYTWTGQRVERRVDTAGKVTAEKRDAWETMILYGETYRKFTVRNSRPLSAEELRKQQEKLDQETARLRNESPDQKQKRLAGEAKARKKDREYFRPLWT